MDKALRAAVDTAAAEGGLMADLDQIMQFDAQPFDDDCVALVRKGAERAGVPFMDIVSGAGHDAVYVARVAPTGMIFVPCEGGISHNEIENATPEDLGAGCQVLLHAMTEKAGAR